VSAASRFVAIPAIYRFVVAGLEGHHGLLATLRAHGREHFTFAGLVSAVVSDLFPGGPAIRATLGFIVIAFFLEKSLFRFLPGSVLNICCLVCDRFPFVFVRFRVAQVPGLPIAHASPPDTVNACHLLNS
jgi:hypothetical protein